MEKSRLLMSSFRSDRNSYLRRDKRLEVTEETAGTAFLQLREPVIVIT
jgi:hypothetical protein